MAEKSLDITKMTIYPFVVDDIRIAQTPEEVREWENWMKNRVKAGGFDFPGNKVGLMTTSCCGGDCDDCDSV